MIVWTASYPRSGNTFLRVLLRELYRLPSYSIYHWGLTRSQLKNHHTGEWAEGDPWPKSIEEMAVSSDPYFVKTHELAHMDGCSAIYLIRDGRDALVSYAHVVLRHDRGLLGYDRETYTDTLRTLMTTDSAFGGWSRNVETWLNRGGLTVCAKFEDLITYPRETVSEILEKLGITSQPNGRAKLPSFDELKSIAPKFFTKGDIGSWRTELDEELQTLFWDRHGQIMERLGYPRFAEASPVDPQSRKCFETDNGDERRVAVSHLLESIVDLRRASEQSQEQIRTLVAECEQKEEEIRSLKRERDSLQQQLNGCHFMPSPSVMSFESPLDLKSKGWLALRMLLNVAVPIRWKERMRPRLGTIRQYPPRPLEIPNRYSRLYPLSRTPVISIVTPSLNQGAFLEETLNSVLDQDYPKLEYVVQDGGSWDGTVEILKQYGDRLTDWESNKDNGQAHALNRGFRKTSGEIMAFLNADDSLLPGTLNYVADFFNRNPGVDVVYGHRILMNEAGSEVGRWILPSHDPEALRWVDFVPQETLFWRRDIWEKAGGALDEEFRFALDWDLILRFIDAGATFVRVPRFLGIFRVQSEQKTQQLLHTVGAHEMAILRERCHGRAVTPGEALIRVSGYMARHTLLTLLYDLGLLRY